MAAKRAGVDASGLGRAFRQVSQVLVLGVVPLVLNVAVLAITFHERTFLFDFHGDLYDAGKAIIDGHDPYRTAFLAHQAAIARAGGHASTTFAVPVYPAPALLASVPLALLPYKLAALTFTVIGVAALIAGLRLLGVRDWRCYGAALLSWPVLHSLRLGQVNELLVLGAAVVWRWRDQLWPAALAVAALVASKLLLWPVWVWLLITRRLRAAVLAIAAGVIAIVICWAVIGFDGFTSYPRMLDDLSAIEGAAGVSLVSVARALGVGRGVGDAVGALGALLLLLASARCLNPQRASDSDDRAPAPERRAYALAVIAALVASPLVWPHYLALTFVAIALLSPRFSVLWLVPLLAWIAPVELTHGDLWRMVPYVVIEVILIGSAITPAGTRNPVGRLGHGLRSTSSRSHMAAHRPTTGP
jgi:glycosyl transferase family 87